ncbi:MAG: hypothetical protein ACXV5I_07770 [Halobacteriota archaeon]
MINDRESLSSNEAEANAAPFPWQEARAQMKRRHADFARALQEKAMERISTIKPEELTPTEALKWFKAGVKIEKLSTWPHEYD